MWFVFIFSFTFMVFLDGGTCCQTTLRGPKDRSGIFSSIQDYAITLIFKTLQVFDAFSCASACLKEPSCQSVNFDTSGHPKHLCELSQRSLKFNDTYKEFRPGFSHYILVEATSDAPCKNVTCKNGAICEPVCGEQGYRCKCGAFNKGQYCQLWTVNVTSCDDIRSKTSYRIDTTYTYMIDSKQTDIYCHLSSDLCGSRGWTLVMKIDGSKSTFAYNSALWSNKNAYDLSAGQTGFDNDETKMPSYWAMPFQSLCVGMKVGNSLNWALIPYPAPSLYDVIADGKNRSFSIGREKWMSLIGGSSLQEYCAAEGFNVGVVKEGFMFARMGVIGNEQNHCESPDSGIGYGLLWRGVSCGNGCRDTCTNGEKDVVAFGYILIK